MASKHFRILAYLSASAIAMTAALVIISAFLVLQDSPSVRSNHTIDTRDLNRVERLVRRAQRALAAPRSQTIVSASQTDLESFVTFAAGSRDDLAGDIRVVPNSVRLLATYKTVHNPIGRYVNVSITIRQSHSGLDIQELDIGHIHMGPRLARIVFDLALSRILGRKLSKDVTDSVAGVTIQDDLVSLAIRPNSTIEDRVKERLTKATSAAQPSTVGFYYRQIMQLASTYDHSRDVPIVDFLQPLLVTAKDRSVRSDPVVEMRSAILALAAYFGGRRLDRMRDGLLPEDLARTPQPRTDYVVLRGHHDHLQHFIVSAAFTLTGGAGFTTIIGEAKEMDDLRRGGEDFSFQDLAADRAGIDFARVAETPEGARHLESLGDRPKSEDLFFPDVSDLPDSMSPSQFNATYHDITSPAFKAVLADIDHRIQTCEAYKPAH